MAQYVENATHSVNHALGLATLYAQAVPPISTQFKVRILAWQPVLTILPITISMVRLVSSVTQLVQLVATVSLTTA